MKKLFMAVIALMMTLSASAQFYIYFSDGTVAKVDSISMVAPADAEDPTNPDNPTIPDNPSTPSQGIGVFSVSATKQVTFSPGNLQYTQSTNTWSFAENQYDYIGTDNVTGGSVSFDSIDGYSKSGTALADKIDLFGWSTASTYFGVSTSTSSNDYSGSFVDWGTNQIGDDVPNTWRTLTLDEWYYLRFDRTNANDLCGVAQVNGVNGLIFLPDNWTCPSGVTFKSGFHSNPGVDYYAAYQTFTAEQWSKLEALGAVFLPATGSRIGLDVLSVQRRGFSISTTMNIDNPYYYYYLSFSSVLADMYFTHRYSGLSVRLVKDVEGENIDPEQPGEGAEEPGEPNPGTPDTPEEQETPSAGIGAFSVSATKQVTFSPGNLQYHPANNVWQFAANQTDYIGDANANISSTYNGWLDLFGWSTVWTYFGVSTSTSSSAYSGLFADWGSNQIGNDAPNTWRTLTYDEWYYLLYNRTNANDLCGVAQVNGVNGLIFLPDNWTCPAGVTFKSGFHSDYMGAYAAYQTFTADQWSKIEKSGAVFLPAAGDRGGSVVGNVQSRGSYWSASEGYYSDDAYYLDFNFVGAGVIGLYRYYGRSVRLVKDL